MKSILLIKKFWGLVEIMFGLQLALGTLQKLLLSLHPGFSKSQNVTDVCMEWGGGGGGEGHHTNICKFLQLPRAISLLAKDVSLSKMAISLILLKALFPVVSMDFP